MSNKTDNEMIAQTNTLALQFYQMQGYAPKEGFLMYRGMHPHEQLCWAMAVEAQLQLTESEVDANLLEEPEVADNDPRIPKTHKEALIWLKQLVNSQDQRALEGVLDYQFVQGWFAIAFLYPGLHPDSSHTRGVKREVKAAGELELLAEKTDSRLVSPVYSQTGWPVVLTTIAHEAFRRYAYGRLTEPMYYAGTANYCGQDYRSNGGED